MPPTASSSRTPEAWAVGSTSPPVLFLDEPTTGTTLLLTTQYLEEADQLADNIVVTDKGRIIAEGSPLELKDRPTPSRPPSRCNTGCG